MFQNIMNTISIYAIPFIMVFVVCLGLIKKVKVYEAFTDGAKEGFSTAVTIIPFLVGMLVAIGVFRASGALDLITSAISPITEMIGMPGEVVPMALIRPLSGGGASGVMNDLMTTYGADSFIGTMASVMNGSTETTFYVIAVYFGAVGIKKTRHAVPSGLLADLAGLLTAVLVTNLMFM